jgi:hypothetical protein
MIVCAIAGIVVGSIPAVGGVATPYRRKLQVTVGRQRAHGLLEGKPFAPDRVELRLNAQPTYDPDLKKQIIEHQYALEFRTGTDYFADRELTCLLALREGEVPFGQSFYEEGRSKGARQRRATVNVFVDGQRTRCLTGRIAFAGLSIKRPGDGIPNHSQFISDFTIFVRFGKRAADGTAKGHVYLRYAPGKKTHLAGTFTCGVTVRGGGRLGSR